MLTVIRGAGDLATGIALRLWRSGASVVLLELAAPTAIRTTVCFSQAVVHGQCAVEGVTARLAASPAAARALALAGTPAVLVDPAAASLRELSPDALVDATLCKRNIGTQITDAPIVIGVGPGFTAGVDCHAVIETMRGHDLGRVLLRGSAAPNTGIPGTIAGHSADRLIKAPAGGCFRAVKRIGDHVEKGETVGYVGELPVTARLSGTLRGLLSDATPVCLGMKSGDVDPRDIPDYCLRVSDKALAVGGGVLEALLGLSGILKNN